MTVDEKRGKKMVTISDCDEPIPILYPECQIRASAQISSETKPANSIRDSEDEVRHPGFYFGHSMMVRFWKISCMH